MKCDDVSEAIVTGSSLSEDMAEHIERCSACRELRANVGELDSAGDADRKRDLSQKSVEHVLARAAEITEQRIRPAHTKMTEWWLVQRLAAAAAVIIAVGFGAMLALRLIAPQEEEVRPVLPAAIETASTVQSLRDEVRAQVSGFESRYSDRGDKAGLEYEIAALNGRMSFVYEGLESELKGL